MEYISPLSEHNLSQETTTSKAAGFTKFDSSDRKTLDLLQQGLLASAKKYKQLPITEYCSPQATESRSIRYPKGERNSLPKIKNSKKHRASPKNKTNSKLTSSGWLSVDKDDKVINKTWDTESSSSRLSTSGWLSKVKRDTISDKEQSMKLRSGTKTSDDKIRNENVTKKKLKVAATRGWKNKDPKVVVAKQNSVKSGLKSKENLEDHNTSKTRGRKNKGTTTNKNVSNSFAKYGIRMPTFEEIIEEKKNLEKYKQCLDGIAEIDVPLHVPAFKDITDLEKTKNKIVQLDCKNLSNAEIRSAFFRHYEYLEDIRSGRQYSERHDKFEEAHSHTASHVGFSYNTSMIVFSNEQKQILASLLCKKFGRNLEDHYYFKVLLPEICLKIFMEEHDMSYAEASDYLNQRPVD